MTGSNPASCNSTTVWEPINPAPPVTRIFIRSDLNLKINCGIVIDGKQDQKHKKSNYLEHLSLHLMPLKRNFFPGKSRKFDVYKKKMFLFIRWL